jgi:hypothetical protein
MSQAKSTMDHSGIRRWTTERGGRPAVVCKGRGMGRIPRFDFGEDDAKFEEIGMRNSSGSLGIATSLRCIRTKHRVA